MYVSVSLTLADGKSKNKIRQAKKERTKASTEQRNPKSLTISIRLIRSPGLLLSKAED